MVPCHGHLTLRRHHGHTSCHLPRRRSRISDLPANQHRDAVAGTNGRGHSEGHVEKFLEKGLRTNVGIAGYCLTRPSRSALEHLHLDPLSLSSQDLPPSKQHRRADRQSCAPLRISAVGSAQLRPRHHAMVRTEERTQTPHLGDPCRSCHSMGPERPMGSTCHHR